MATKLGEIVFVGDTIAPNGLSTRINNATYVFRMRACDRTRSEGMYVHVEMACRR